MGEPSSKGKKKEKKELGGKDDDGEEKKGPSLDFLKVDRSLRPDGFHFEAEMQRRVEQSGR